MTETRNQKPENYRRCQAVTCKGRRCRNEAVYFRIYEGDRLEYLSCKTHFQDFRPHPGQKGQQPPKEAM
ncbi:MAG: hypothetical protein V2B20_16330 [Pseudomonadota bacterium]